MKYVVAEVDNLRDSLVTDGWQSEEANGFSSKEYSELVQEVGQEAVIHQHRVQGLKRGRQGAPIMGDIEESEDDRVQIPTQVFRNIESNR